MKRIVHVAVGRHGRPVLCSSGDLQWTALAIEFGVFRVERFSVVVFESRKIRCELPRRCDPFAGRVNWAPGEADFERMPHDVKSGQILIGPEPDAFETPVDLTGGGLLEGFAEWSLQYFNLGSNFDFATKTSRNVSA